MIEKIEESDSAAALLKKVAGIVGERKAFAFFAKNGIGMESMTYQQIGTLFGVSKQCVYNYVRDTKEKLKTYL